MAKRDLHHVAIEIRQDLITDDAGQRTWAALFARLLPPAYQQITSLQVAK
jgi:predicted N-formylglutamate amidohydrolase